MSALLQFDVHKAGAIGGVAVGAFVATIRARTHAIAKHDADELYPGQPIVVLPHRKPNENLERAVAHLDRLAAKQRHRQHSDRLSHAAHQINRAR